MDVPATLTQLQSLTVDERLHIVEAIWETIACELDQLQVTEAQKQELERRLAAHAVAPENVVAWEDVRARALARTRR